MPSLHVGASLATRRAPCSSAFLVFAYFVEQTLDVLLRTRSPHRLLRRQTGIFAGPPSGMISFGSVTACDLHRLAVTGAISFSTRPSGVTSIHASSSDDGIRLHRNSRQRRRALSGKSSPSRRSPFACSIATYTRFAPATRSIAPPIPFNIFPGIAQFASVPFSSTCSAPSAPSNPHARRESSQTNPPTKNSKSPSTRSPFLSRH